ncbi:DNA-binding WRKY [Artemisia annua]|uniref:DNA-binding WRKY n=1 Tax=Artemisia annua TaxID=35608 RepID=A0A2U1LMI7_ARTAN|nr:DNA-binding WRKY [Artemisia annua]
MDNNKKSLPLSTPYLRPTISIPTSSSVDNLFTAPGETPGPMTLISNFFSDNDAGPDTIIFSQLLAGLSPATLLESPAQGSLGMSHQQALAHVTAQAAQLQPISTTHHHVPPTMPDQNVTMMAPELSKSSCHSHPPLVAAGKPAEDGYNWRKYGQKQVKGSEYARSYYKCTHQNCPVKKKVERGVDGQVTKIIYKGKHNHQPPRTVGNFNDTEPFNDQTSDFNYSRDNSSIKKDQESSHEISGSWDNDDVAKHQAKKRNIEAKGFDPGSSHRTLPDSRIIVQATSKIDLLDDGYKWRKYGQKAVKGNSHPRQDIFPLLSTMIIHFFEPFLPLQIFE